MAAHTENEIVVDAPLDVVWDMTNDVEDWPNLFTEYAETEILERRGENTVLFRLTMHPDPQGNQWSWVSERTWDREGLTVDAHRVEKGWFEHMDIHWSYEETGDGGTRMRWTQDFAMRPDAPFDDGAMENRINANTKVQMRAIKERIERRVREGAASTAGA